MTGRYLLDTNIVIGLFAADETITESLKQAESVFVSSIVLGELCYGAYKSQRVQENISRMDKFAVANAVLHNDTETARQYGAIKERLYRKGHPIPENDIWIAAVALQFNLTLVSRDAHFAEITDLQVDSWLET